MKKKILCLIIFSSLTFTGCWFYSFTGASISPKVKTISIQNFENQADLVVPYLSQRFTEKLTDYFLSQTTLKLVPSNGDLQISGVITKYYVQPQAVTSGENAALNRLYIYVKVQFVNTTDETQSWTNEFSNFADYEATQNLTEVESTLIDEISQKLSEDIFNKAVVNW